MEQVGFGLGVLLATFGPVLLIPLTWALYRYLLRPWVLPLLLPESNVATRRRFGTVLAIALVSGALALSYFPGKQKFDQLCNTEAVPRINEQVRVAGFFRNHLLPYEARLYLDNGPFDFIEAPHPYRKQVYIRYTRSSQGGLQESEITRPASRYWVLSNLQELSYGLTLNEKRVIEFGSGRELAKASMLTFQGGPLSWLLGVYALSSCPDPRSPSGAEHLHTYTELERLVLGQPPAD